MKSSWPYTAWSIAIALLLCSVADAKHGNTHFHLLHRHKHHRVAHPSAAEQGHGLELRDASLEVRQGKCQFPTDAGLVAVTPGASNAGWAMSPDQCCEPGSYCPYACPPGQVMAQWDPDVTAYSYPQSMVCVSQTTRWARSILTAARTVVFTATRAVTSTNPSPRNPTVLTVPETLAVGTRRAVMSPFARPCCPGMKPC